MMFRDIHQLRDAPLFGVTAIEGLSTAETSLREALRFVPFCDEHRFVWSSHFTSIILEAASQVDSIWKATEKIVHPAAVNRNVTIKNHYNRFGNLVAAQKVIFFGGASPCVIHPFEEWENISSFSSPTWWEAYNKLKHDRFANQTEATLEHAVNAVGALLLAIIYSGSCDLALISAKLLDTSQYNPWAFTKTGLLRDVPFNCQSKIETELFAHPLGVFGTKDCNLSGHWDSASPRFNIWWALNSEQYTHPKVSP
jgi:hypothetical protein